ncbi:MAG: helix-turn-helix domain-containing protein [Lepagella sp.]
MNILDESNFDLYVIDSSNVRHHNPFSYPNQNGFMLCQQGRITLVLDDHLYEMCEHDLFIYPAFSKTQVESVGEDFKGIAGRADFNFILSSLDNISNTQGHLYIRSNPHTTLTLEQEARIEEIFDLIDRRRKEDLQLKTQMLMALARVFCCEVINAYITNKSMRVNKQNRKDKVFQDFLTLLYSNFREHRDVQFYAQKQNLTPRYFTTLIRKVSGKTPLHWISTFVIIEAKRLLSDPKISIKEVASSLHFSDQSFFGRYFKLYAGCSPTEYKNQNGETAL